MSSVRGVVLDAGPFIALERRNRVMTELARRFAHEKTPLVTSAGVIAQIWRGGARAQVPIAFLVARTVVVDLTQPVAKLLGRMLGATRTKDVIDAHVVLLARARGWPVLSSDAGDLRRLDPTLVIEEI